MKKIFLAIFILSLFFGLSSKVDAYLLGFKSRDNSISNIQQIEKKHGIHLPIVSFIFDPYGDHVAKTIKDLPTTLGLDRIYHISISPNNYSAQDVAEGKFDKQYKQFFALIKSGDIKVIFRTMHEMNGGRYPRSSNPYRFKKARIHIRNLSRAEGLSQSDILFDMSVNARDLPAKGGKPAQTATFIQCQSALKAKLKCSTFEDYYPGDKYVDILGVTFFNRGKGNSNRRRGTPEQIVNAAGRKTLDRLKKFNKPIFVDEVATTAVDYSGPYSFNKSLEVYKKNSSLKNTRLLQLRDFLKAEPSILGANYFNVDLTNGLKNRTLGELDRSVIDIQSNKFYTGILELIKSGGKIEKGSNNLLNLFNIKYLNLTGAKMLVPSKYLKPIQDIYAMIFATTTDMSRQLNLIQGLEDQGIRNLYRRFSSKDAKAIADILRNVLEMQKESKK